MQPGRGGSSVSAPGPFQGAPVSKWLLIVNIAVFFLDVLLTTPGNPLFLQKWGFFSIEKTFEQGQLWRLLTFQFLHGGGGHLFANCIGLFFFAPFIERWMTSRPFLVFYLLCGVAGTLFFTVLYFIPGLFDGYGTNARMVGASAGLFGILAAFYYVAPDARVLLFFVIPMKMRTLGIAYFAWETVGVLFNLHNAGGSAGHLGGALFGLLVLKVPQARELVVKISQIGSNKKPPKKIRDAKILREDERSPIELSKEIDRILDKINDKGMQSLTPGERQTLDKARRKP